MKKYLLGIVMLLNLSSLAPPARAEAPPKGCSEGRLHEENKATIDIMTRFLTDLKTAIASNDKPRVATLAHYPLRVGTAKGHFSIYSQKEFVSQYNRILPAKVRAFLLRQEPRCISRVGSQGFSVGSGQIWFDEYPNGTVRIFSVNPFVYPGD